MKCIPEGAINNNPSIGYDNGSASNRRQVIIWTNDDLGYWCIYANSSIHI